MSNKKLTLTIVIPAYNEQDYLKTCLESIANQSVLPDEVIVVDNNSTDKTVQIAKSYSFVSLIQETRQHQSFAQKTGFDATKSDIIGRIDADSVLPVNWVKNVKVHFQQNPNTEGLTGGTAPYDMSSAKIGSLGFKFYINIASAIAGFTMLWGANCAIRRSGWQKIRGQVITRGDIWEDYDLSFCLAQYGNLEAIDGIDIESSFRAIHNSLVTQTRYQFRAVRTFYFRQGIAKACIFFSLWLSLFLLFVPVMLDKYILTPLLNTIRDIKRVSPENTDVVRLETE